VPIKGREMRKELHSSVPPGPRVMRLETARILIESMKGQ
jgi:hypothetical protein